MEIDTMRTNVEFDDFDAPPDDFKEYVE